MNASIGSSELAPSTPSRVVVLASGSGTLLQSVLDAAAQDGYPAQVVGVVVDRDCVAEGRAASANVPSRCIALKDYPDRGSWNTALADAVASFNPDLVVSAGFMKILSPEFLGRFDRVINTHPALLPSFPGAHAVRDAMAYGVKVTGSTVHLVDAGVDTGPVLAQEAVPILDSDDEDSLHERIKIVERRLLVEVIAAVATRGVKSDGRKAVIQ